MKKIIKFILFVGLLIFNNMTSGRAVFDSFTNASSSLMQHLNHLSILFLMAYFVYVLESGDRVEVEE